MKKNTKYLWIGFALFLVVFLVTYGSTFAKYTTDSVWNYYLKSKGFYFDSPLLDGNSYQDQNWDGGSTYFQLHNYLNDSLITDYDISYEVHCTILGDASEISKCMIAGEDKDVYQGVLSGGVGKQISDLYFDVVPTGSEELTGVSVEIEVQSTSPYHKTLKNTFVLNKGEQELGALNLAYEEKDAYSYLTVTNSYLEDKCVKLSFPAEDLRIDTEDKRILHQEANEEGYVQAVTFQVSKKDSVRFRFYPTNGNVHLTKNAFTIQESKEC